MIKSGQRAVRHVVDARVGQLLLASAMSVLVVSSVAPTLISATPKHPILNLQQQNHHSSYTKSPGFGHQNVTSRPLERPSLNLVSRSTSSAGNFSAEPMPEGAADWFMMGGGDLAHEEGRSHLSFASLDNNDEPRQLKRANVTRRMAEVKQHRKHRNNSSKTIFDDEQQSSESNDSNEIYDDVEENSPAMAGTQKEPECAAHGRYYCTFKEDYPLKLVTEVTKYYKWPLEKLFRDLHAQIMPKLAQDSTGNLVCDSVTRVVRPGWARNTNERWLVVINTDNYHQYVTEVVCQYGTNSRCNFIPPCYYSSCQQRYNTQKLLVIDPTNPYRGPFLSEFLFPSCCVCYVPSSSDSFQDKYRSSPATIYQRTMQQEAASNLNPPQFRPPGLSLLEEAFSSSSSNGNGAAASQQMGVGAMAMPGSDSVAARSAAGSSVQATMVSGTGGANNQPAGKQPAGPGEIRRAGDQYRRQAAPGEQQQLDESSRRSRQMDPTGNDYLGELSSFPQLGLSDSLVNQKSGSRE